LPQPHEPLKKKSWGLGPIPGVPTTSDDPVNNKRYEAKMQKMQKSWSHSTYTNDTNKRRHRGGWLFKPKPAMAN